MRFSPRVGGVIATKVTMTMFHHVILVPLVGIPPEILDSVIGSHSIIVARFHPGRARPYERLQDEPMHQKIPCLSVLV